MKAKKFALLAVMLLLFLSGCGRQVRFGDPLGRCRRPVRGDTGLAGLVQRAARGAAAGRSAASRPTCWSKAVWHRPKMQRQEDS